MSTIGIIVGLLVGLVIIILSIPFLIRSWRKGKMGPDSARDFRKASRVTGSDDIWDQIKPK